MTPPPKQIVEIDVLAAHVDENHFDFSLDAIAKRCGIAGKDETPLNEAALAFALASGKKPGKKKFNVKEFIWQLPARGRPHAEADAMATLLVPESSTRSSTPRGRARPTNSTATCCRWCWKCGQRDPRQRGLRGAGARPDPGQARRRITRDLVPARHRRQHGRTHQPKWKTKIFDAQGIARSAHPTGNPSFADGKTKWTTKHEHWLPPLIKIADKYHNAACKFLETFILGHMVNGRIHAELHALRSEAAAHGRRGFPIVIHHCSRCLLATPNSGH